MSDQTVTAQFGPLLRRHRTDTGLTQRMLADLSTVSVRAIRDLEQGRARPREDTMRLITDALRLGRRARADLEQAADRGRRTPRPGLDPDQAAPPTVLDPIVGRDAEVATVAAELTDGSSRLITVTGLPGVGKTRLAVEVATRLHAAGTPVLWPGTPTRDERLRAVLTAATAALFGRGGDLTDLVELVADRDTLVVLDGVGADRPRPEPLLRLLGDCPRLRVLITADHPCDLPGERPFLLTPLTPAAAGELFRHHARPGHRPTAADVPVLAEVCALVDGLPPALATAASWLDVYGLDALCHVLRADPAALLGQPLMSRLRARVDALPPAERSALADLAALGEFTLDDLVGATGRSVPEAGLLLRGLLSHGVVRGHQAGGQTRFQVLALVRALT